MTVDNYVLIACSNSSDSGKWFEMEIGGKKRQKRRKEKGMPVRLVIKRLILLILSTCNPTIGFGFLSLFLILSCQLNMQWLTVCSFQDTYIFFVPGQNCKRELV